jgi:hypothetical protein
MRADMRTKFLLTLIAIALVAIALRPYLAPQPVQAQSGDPSPFTSNLAPRCCAPRTEAARFMEEWS